VKKGQRRDWRSFEEARQWARKSGALTEKDWRQLVKNTDFPQNIPKLPSRVFRDDWKGWGDWLGTGNIAPQNANYLPFEEARSLARDMGLQTEREWRAYKASNELPEGMPRKPEHVYRNTGWKGFKDFLVNDHS
jgi:hypothetical protein